MNIEEYRLTFDNPSKWFIAEVKKGYHVNRIANAIENRYYLSGQHKVLLREDATYKGKQLITRKTIINYAKTVLNFNSTYLLDKLVSLAGDESVTMHFLISISWVCIIRLIIRYLIGQINSMIPMRLYLFQMVR